MPACAVVVGVGLPEVTGGTDMLAAGFTGVSKFTSGSLQTKAGRFGQTRGLSREADFPTTLLENCSGRTRSGRSGLAVGNDGVTGGIYGPNRCCAQETHNPSSSPSSSHIGWWGAIDQPQAMGGYPACQREI
ncbi:hypothetical protein A176_001827 [Myxococcus hansupus]|uniref:Uncharacterized protein n=1 Tax=Pseudomyxococcus hansupus TaxID=1297742 RepID=A0A0H4WUC9_9BACT|nr:hypothetical protein A176_001827 [Myxococcus hansupus]